MFPECSLTDVGARAHTHAHTNTNLRSYISENLSCFHRFIKLRQYCKFSALRFILKVGIFIVCCHVQSVAFGLKCYYQNKPAQQHAAQIIFKTADILSKSMFLCCLYVV